MSRNRGGRNTKILSVGRFVNRKGHLELIAAVERLRTKGLGVTLTIAGAAGPLSGQLNDLLMTSSDWLTIIEDPPDHVLADCYEQADVFALLSRDVATEFEGFGIVFLEASSWGLPVLAGRSGGTSDAVREGVTGRLASNVDEAADHLADLAMHPGLRAAMGEAGRAWARTHTEDVLAERYTELHAALRHSPEVRIGT